MRESYKNRWLVCAVALTVIGVSVGCKPAPPPPPFRSTQGTWTVGTISAEGSDRYTYVDQLTGLQVTAPTSNIGGNLRIAAVRNRTPSSLNHGSCVTWHGPMSDGVQPGIVLRALLEPDRTRAIMVTNNVWLGFRSMVNVHLADSNMSPPYTQIAAVNMTAGLGTAQDLAPLPWRFCARANGATVTVKAWSIPAHPIEPDWADPFHAVAVQVPESAVYPGKPGVYTGHLKAGVTTVIGEHSTERQPDRVGPPPIRYQDAPEADS